MISVRDLPETTEIVFEWELIDNEELATLIMEDYLLAEHIIIVLACSIP
jgi:hypothetical protein